MNPYGILIGTIVVLSLIGGAGWKGYSLGSEHEIAQRVKDEAVRQETREIMARTAAEAISAIEVKNVTVRQRVETEIREKPVYRDCRADADGLRLINAALTGSETGPTGDRELPAAPAPDRSDIRGDSIEAGRGGDSVPQVPGSSPR